MKSKLLLLTAAVAAIAGPIVVGALNPPGLHAQAPPPAAEDRPTFEAASVKANKSGDGGTRFIGQPGGRMTATNVPLRELIRFSYQLQSFQLEGGPSWIASERFDIVAKAAGDLPPTPIGTPGMMNRMMQTLLADRFKLVVHMETKELPIYALVMARSDGKLGPQLRPAAVDCTALAAARGRGGAPPPGPSAPGERPACGMRIGPGQMTGGGFPLSQLAVTLSQFAQRVVVDRTGLSGNFDLDLTWTPDQLPPPGAGAPPGASPLPPIDPNGPSLFTALQEQLGLKLDSQKGPVEVLVIDRVERPTDD